MGLYENSSSCVKYCWLNTPSPSWLCPEDTELLDEYFEALTLIQTHKIKNFPIIIFGKEYHKDLLEHIEQMSKSATISNDDAHLFLVTDDIDEAVELIIEKSIKQYGLKPENKIKPFKWLFEHD